MKQFFYFLTLFASIGTVGLVATNPKLVQQGTATAGRIAKAVTDAIADENKGGNSNRTVSEEESLAAFLADSPYAAQSRSTPPSVEPLEEAPAWQSAAEAGEMMPPNQGTRKPLPSDRIANEPNADTQIANHWPEAPSSIAPAGYHAPKTQDTSPIVLASTGSDPTFAQHPSAYSSPPTSPPASPPTPTAVPVNAPAASNPLAYHWSDPPSHLPTSDQTGPTVQSVPNTNQQVEAISNFSQPIPEQTAFSAPVASLPPLPAIQSASDPFSAAAPLTASAATPDSVSQNPMAQLGNEPSPMPSSFAPPVANQQVGYVAPNQPTAGYAFDQMSAPEVLSVENTASSRENLSQALPPPQFETFQASQNLQSDPNPNGLPAPDPAKALPLPGTTPTMQNMDQFQINPSVMAEVIPCHGTEMVARVGTQVILMCDILPQLRRIGLRQFKEQLKNVPEEERKSIPPEAKEQFLEQFIVECYPSFLKQQITFSMIYNDFLMAKTKEETEFFTKKLGEEFDEEDVPAMMKEFEVGNLVELKAFLKEELGSSLERERMLTVQSKISQQWVMFSVKAAEGECSPEEMMEYYTAHRSEFETKARVKWQELQVLFSKHPSEQEAWKKMVWMGNEVARGVPMDEMAKVNSEGFTASNGGVWDWTSKGSLSSADLEKLVFTHPVGQLSPIVKTATGLHIVKVLEREEDSLTPFIQAQVKIRGQIQNQRRAQNEQEYFDELQRKYPSIVLRDSIDFRPSRGLSSSQASGNAEFSAK